MERLVLMFSILGIKSYYITCSVNKTIVCRQNVYGCAGGWNLPGCLKHSVLVPSSHAHIATLTCVLNLNPLQQPEWSKRRNMGALSLYLQIVQLITPVWKEGGWPRTRGCRGESAGTTKDFKVQSVLHEVAQICSLSFLSWIQTQNVLHISCSLSDSTLYV